MAGNLDPLTPTMLSLPTCDPRCEPSIHEDPARGANLAKPTEVEQGEADDLTLSCVSWNDRPNFILSAHAHRSDRG